MRNNSDTDDGLILLGAHFRKLWINNRPITEYRACLFQLQLYDDRSEKQILT